MTEREGQRKDKTYNNFVESGESGLVVKSVRKKKKGERERGRKKVVNLQ